MLGEYSYDSLMPNQIRLLRLRPGHESSPLEGELVTCYLIVDDSEPTFSRTTFKENNRDLVGAGEYDAVSYFWGAGEPTTQITIYDKSDPIYVQGLLRIKENLEVALKIFRKSIPVDDPQYFWIDAVCINQGDKREKGAHIPKMAHIYNHAGQVRVWLGNATPGTTIAMDFVQELVRLDNLDKLCNDDRTAFKWAAFIQLMRSPWFNRRWIIQEIALARDATVYCGEQSVSWAQFKWAVSLFISRQEALRALFQQSRDFDHHPDYLGELEALGAKVLVDTSNDLFRKSEGGEIIEHLLSLEALMSTLVMFDSSTPHDIVYAILWLAHDATPGSSRSAALYSENADTPTGSPGVGPVPNLMSTDTIPSIHLVADKASDSTLAENLPSHILGESQMHRLAYQLEPEQGQQDSSGRFSGFLKPGEQGRSGKARTNSLISLRRAERPFHQQPDRILVDYEKSVYEVCKDFIEFAVRRSKSLDIICVPWAPSPSKERIEPQMPSWIKHFSGRPFELRPRENVYNRVNADCLVGTPGRGLRTYAACGKTRAYNTDLKKTLIVNRALVGYGFVLDVVRKLGAEAMGGIIPSSWLELLEIENSTDLPQNFWRTLVADRDVGGQKPPPAYFELACKWAFDRRARGSHLNTRQLLNEGRLPEEATRFLRRVQAVIWDRKLVLTEGTERTDGTEQTPQLLALVPTAAREGDLICILHGLSVPAILRKKERSELSDETFKRRPIRPPTHRGNLKKRRTVTTQTIALQSANESFTRPKISNMTANTGADSGTSVTQKCNDANQFSTTSPDAHYSTSTQRSESSSTGVNRSSSSLLQNVPEDQYIFIGACYVHGMMAGEAFKHREDTKTSYQEFWLV